MLVAVGGHTRNIGKTTLMCSIIANVPEANWCAIKITQHGHGICAENGKPCDCAPGDATHPFVLDEQTIADETDSGRYRKAGAVHSYWLRTAMGELGHAIPEVKRLMATHSNVIVESNSLLRFVQPDLYVPVIDFSRPDIKDSARLFMDRAHAYVVNTEEHPVWQGVPERWFRAKPIFRTPEWSGVYDLVRARLEPVLLHITTPAVWELAQRSGSLACGDFLHLCRPSQLEFVLEKHFAGRNGLLLLTIETAKLLAPLRFERSEEAQLPFPHLYGGLNIDAVMNVRMVEAGAS